MFKLDLDNFLSEEADGSQYVLTSPRSLEACRQLGIKPLELLPQSLEEYDQQLSGTPLAEIYKKFDEDESNRVEKLATVRTLWQKLKEKKPFQDINFKSFDTKQWKNSESSKHHPKRKKKTSKSMKESRQIRHQENLRRRASPTDELENKESSTEDIRKQGSSTEDMKKYGSSTEDMNKYGSSTEYLKKYGNSTDYMKKYGSLHAVDKKSAQPFLRSLSDGDSPEASFGLQKKLQRPKSAGDNYKVKSYSVQNIPASSFANINPLDIVFRGCGSAYNLTRKIPVHDQRILELMTMRRLLERQMEEQADKYRLAWEEQLKKQRREQETAAAQHHAYVSNRRARENAENTKRLAEIEAQFLASQKSLWNSIMMKQQRAQQLLRDIQQARKEQIMQRQREEELKKQAQEGELKRKEESETKYTKFLLDISEQKMKLALEKKRRLEEEYKKKLTEMNLEDDHRRQMMLRHLAQESEMTLRQMRKAIEERERKVRENYDKLHEEREQLIKQRQMSYDSRRIAAARVRSELDSGMAQLRDEVRKLQLLSQQKAQEKVEKNKQRKRDELRQARESRERQHQLLLMSVQLEESAAEHAMRQHIAQKLARTSRVIEEKEKSIQQARKVANTTAQMRQQIKTRLSPETFDRKAMRADLEIKLSSRPSTPAPTQRSHIILG